MENQAHDPDCAEGWGAAAGEAAGTNAGQCWASEERDQLGCTSQQWLHYVCEEAAVEAQLPAEAAGMPIRVFDAGHAGMKLDDFAAHPTAQAAGLKRAHILALRLYSTPLQCAINAPLVNGCSVDRPHPFPTLVILLFEAVHRLSCSVTPAQEMLAPNATGTAKSGVVETAKAEAEIRAKAESGSTRDLWRRVTDLPTSDEFKHRGGTDFGFVSASAVREPHDLLASLAHNDRAADLPPPLILKIKADVRAICELSWLAVLPLEAEFIFAPGTYFEPKLAQLETFTLPSGETLAIEVLEVVPH